MNACAARDHTSAIYLSVFAWHFLQSVPLGNRILATHPRFG